jgi:hypothetical protein
LPGVGGWLSGAIITSCCQYSRAGREPSAMTTLYRLRSKKPGNELFSSRITNRQMRITRVYSPQVWKLALVTNGLYNLAFWGGLLWLISSALVGKINESQIYLLGIIFICGAITGAMRAITATNLIHSEQRVMKISLGAYAFLGPVVSLIYLTNIIFSAASNQITWRGIGYQLISPNETLTFSRPVPENSTKPPSRKRKKRKTSVQSSSQ